MMGGLAAILNPLAPLGMSVEALQHSPFANFLIPGLILFTVLGLGNLVAALVFLRNSAYRGCVSGIFSWALVIWIIVQCVMLNGIHFLHVLFFLIGTVEVVLSTVLMFKKQLFPVNILVATYKNMRKEVM